VGVHVLTLALMVIKLIVDGQLPEDRVTRARDADLQEAGMLDRTRRVSRLLAKTRRDECEHIGSGGYTVWKTVPRSEEEDRGQTSGCGLSEMAYYQPAPVFRPAYAGTRSEVYPRWSECLRTYQGPGCSLPGRWRASTRMAGLDGEREQPAQSGHSSRGSDAPPGSRQRRAQGEGPQATSFRRGGVRRC
jgi:hypothetical protein